VRTTDSAIKVAGGQKVTEIHAAPTLLSTTAFCLEATVIDWLSHAQ